MYKKILVPIDGSVTAAKGLAEASKLAKDQNATIRLIHVVNELMIIAMPEAAIYSGEIIEALRETGQQLLDKAQQQLVATGLQVEAQLLEAHGKQAGQVIVADAEQSHADIIVLGTHGRRGLSRLVMGSDAEYIVRLARVPVLLVRNLQQ